MFDYFSLPQSEKEELVREFEKRYERKGINECWIWEGVTTNSIYKESYGRFYFKGKYYLAHRLAWILQFKTNIPNELFVCHRCDVPLCVNAHHVFIGNARTNATDMMLKDRSNFKKKLVERLEISRLILEEKMTFEEIKELYNCGNAAVYRILDTKEVVAKYGKVDLSHRKSNRKRETWPKIVPLNQLPATQPRRQT